MRYLKTSFHNKRYFTGSFSDPSQLSFDRNIEINHAVLPNDFSAPRHYHAQSKTWVLVLKGAMHFKIDDQAVTVAAGEVLIFEKGVWEEVVSVEPGTESITIHSPSIQGGDKVSS